MEQLHRFSYGFAAGRSRRCPVERGGYFVFGLFGCLQIRREEPGGCCHGGEAARFGATLVGFRALASVYRSSSARVGNWQSAAESAFRDHNSGEMIMRTPLVISTIVIYILCSGCSRAPSVSIIGSFFPIWMICIAVGVVAAFIGRAVLVRCGLERDVGPLWLFYPATVTLCACILWEAF